MAELEHLTIDGTRYDIADQDAREQADTNTASITSINTSITQINEDLAKAVGTKYYTTLDEVLSFASTLERYQIATIFMSNVPAQTLIGQNGAAKGLITKAYTTALGDVYDYLLWATTGETLFAGRYDPSTSTSSYTRYATRSDVVDINTSLSSLQASVTTNTGNIEQNTSDISEIQEEMSRLANMVYPVGSIYMSMNDVSPETLFGGEWERIQDRFLLAAGENYELGETGGEEAVALITSQLPSHSHDLPSHSHDLPSHTHSLPSHSHSIPSHTHSFSATTGSSGSHTHTLNIVATATAGGSQNRACSSSVATGTLDSAINSAGSHTHSVSGTTGSYSGTSGTTSGTSGSTSGTSGSASGTSGATGSGTAHNNMPPYLAVYMWQRTA